MTDDIEKQADDFFDTVPCKTDKVSKSAQTPCYVPFVTEANVNWFDINDTMLPPQRYDEFYGDRYSVPVLIANAVTGQIEEQTVVYDYEDGGWCLHGLRNGPSCKDYELMLPTHFCFLPCFAI